MILHIIHREKFDNDYITSINRLFDPSEHLFFVWGENEGYEFPKLNYGNVIYSDLSVKNSRLWKAYSKADKIILHSLFLGRNIILLNMLDLIFRKPMVWAIWGGDLYNAHWGELKPHRSIKSRISTIFRKRLISRIKIAVAWHDDYAYLKANYRTEAKHLFATYYYDFMRFPSEAESRSNDGKINIMVGHSASDTCRHIETFRILAKYKGRIRVYAPLSYGDKEYAQEVIQAGTDIFGSDFAALTEYMNTTDYTKFLGSIDVGIFNNNRQQGNGNIARLLYLGKKVFTSPENTLYKNYRQHGAYTYLFPEDLTDETLFEPFTEEQKQACAGSIESIYSDEAFRKNREAVFTA